MMNMGNSCRATKKPGRRHINLWTCPLAARDRAGLFDLTSFIVSFRSPDKNIVSEDWYLQTHLEGPVQFEQFSDRDRTEMVEVPGESQRLRNNGWHVGILFPVAFGVAHWSPASHGLHGSCGGNKSQPMPMDRPVKFPRNPCEFAGTLRLVII